MISNEKRREVAKEMREYDVAGFKESVIVPFLDCLGRGYTNWRGILDELANLIDRPTCRNIGGVGGTNGEYYDFFCSVCGFASGVTDPKYCPNCGAEVVDDD